MTRIARAAFCAFFVILLFVIPFSIAAIEIAFPVLLLTWALGGRNPPEEAALTATLPAERPTLWALVLYFVVCVLSLIPSKFLSISLSGLIGKTAE